MSAVLPSERIGTSPLDATVSSAGASPATIEYKTSAIGPYWSMVNKQRELERLDRTFGDDLEVRVMFSEIPSLPSPGPYPTPSPWPSNAVLFVTARGTQAAIDEVRRVMNDLRYTTSGYEAVRAPAHVRPVRTSFVAALQPKT